jgi:hypothetical protein
LKKAMARVTSYQSMSRDSRMARTTAMVSSTWASVSPMWDAVPVRGPMLAVPETRSRRPHGVSIIDGTAE